MKKLVAIDIGNTYVKWGLFNGQTLESTGRAPVSSGTSDLVDQITAQIGATPDGCAVASVNDPVDRALAEHLRDKGIGPVRQIGQDIPAPIRTAVADPSRVGVDRLLAALAASKRVGDGLAVVVIDCGSATTVDCVSAEGVFLGGMIAPGPGLAARALSTFTDRLPPATLIPPTRAIGRNTAEAIGSGLHYNAVGFLRTALDAVRAEMASTPVAVATGGHASAIVPHVDPAIPIFPHLVLEGIRLSVPTRE